METSEILEEIKGMPKNEDRITRVKKFIAEDPKFKTPFHGDLLVPIPQSLLFLLEYEGPIDDFTEARYYGQRQVAPVDHKTYKVFSAEVKKIRERWGE